MANASAPRPTRTAKIVSVHNLSPRVRVIRLEGPELQGAAWSPGQKIKIHSEHWSRSYTPSRMDPSEGWMELVFCLHGNGPASRWAEAASVGESVSFVGPVNSVRGPDADTDIDWAMFLGDETAIGLAAAIVEGLPSGIKVLGAIEVAREDTPALQAYNLSLESTVREPEDPGRSLLGWLESTTLPEGRGMAWLSGETVSIQLLKAALLQTSHPDLTLRIKAYWSSKGHAHRKSLKL